MIIIQNPRSVPLLGNSINLCFFSLKHLYINCSCDNNFWVHLFFGLNFEVNIWGIFFFGWEMSTAAETAAEGYRTPFTAVQWQELEHQAMIYKYLVAGVPVPPDLVVPIRRSFEPISARFFHHPGLGYYSYYGKKFDPEPGRCRRTDGKKWRCAKDAYPDSKYCERHMHRGRNRSRKHVESQSTAPSLLTSVSHNTTGSSKTSGNFQRSSSGSLENTPLYSSANSEGPSYGSATTKMQMEPTTYAIDCKGYGYFHGMASDADEQNFSFEASAGTKSLGMGSNTDSMWCLMSPQLPLNPMVKPKNDSQLFDSSRQIRMPNPFEPMNDATISGQQHQHCFFSSDIGSPGTVKQEQRSMRPFFDEWPTTKESWSNLDDEGSNKNNFCTPQLSISIPMTPPDFSSRSSCSPNGELTSSSSLLIQLKSHSITRQR